MFILLVTVISNMFFTIGLVSVYLLLGEDVSEYDIITTSILGGLGISIFFFTFGLSVSPFGIRNKLNQKKEI